MCCSRHSIVFRKGSQSSRHIVVPTETMTVWPSGLRRCVKAAVRKGVGSNPTAVILCEISSTTISRSASLKMALAVWSSGMIPASGAGGPGFDSRNSPLPYRCARSRVPFPEQPSATPSHISTTCLFRRHQETSVDPESNQGPSDLQSDALPTELSTAGSAIPPSRNTTPPRAHATDNNLAETRDRTGDLQIFSLTLSQLSYLGRDADSNTTLRASNLSVTLMRDRTRLRCAVIGCLV